jgi:hypothetical protein
LIYVEGPCVSSALLLIHVGGVHIGARALLGINLIWFGYIARLSQWGGGGVFLSFNDFYLASLCLGGGGGQHPVVGTELSTALFLAPMQFSKIPALDALWLILRPPTGYCRQNLCLPDVERQRERERR